MKKYLIIAALVASATTTLAEQEVKLDETVVSTEGFGTKVQDIAKNVYVITGKEMEDKGASNIADGLKGVPGVIVNKMDGAFPLIDLRGSGATAGNNTIILVDGMPFNGLSGFDINSIPLGQVDRIEIIQGGGAVIYGDGAVGGVVNVITKQPENKLNYGSVGLEISSFNTQRANFSYGTKIGEKFLLSTAYSGYSSMDYRSRNPEYKDDKDTIQSIWLTGKYLLDKGSVELRYNHNENKDYYTGNLEKKAFESDPRQAGKWGGMTYKVDDLWNLSYTQQIVDNLDLLVYGGYYRSESKNQNQLTQEYFVKPQIKYTYWRDSYFIVGGDYRDGNREFKENVLVNGVNQKAPDDERKSYAGYILNKTTIGNWQFSQGFRREKVKYKYSDKEYGAGWVLKAIKPMEADYSNNNNYEFGVNYLYSDTGNVYVNYTRATRTPTIDDAGAWSGPVKTQKNDTYEIGVRDYIGITQISTSVFYTRTENEIYYDKTDSNNSTNRNFDGNVDRTGVQLSLQHYFEKLTLRENISYIDAKVTSGKYDGKDFAGVPNWTLNLGATYNFTQKLLGNIDMYYQSDMYAQDDFDNYFSKSNDYITVDTNFKYTLNSGLELYAGVRNLFNEKYANAITSTRSTYGDGPRTVYYPADGRSYFVGFKYNF